jgi:hypothetical protein
MTYPQYEIHLKVNLPSSWGRICNTGYYVNGLSILSEDRVKFLLQIGVLLRERERERKSDGFR